MLKEKYRGYFNWGITVFLIILGSILTFFFFYRFDVILSGISTLNGILAPIMAGIVIAYLLSPIRDTFTRLMNRIPGKQSRLRKGLTRGVAILLSILALLAIIGFIAGTLIPQVVDTLRIMITNVERYIAALEEWVQPLNEFNPAIYTSVTKLIDQAEGNLRDFFQDDLVRLVSTLTSGVLLVGRSIYNFVLGVIVSIYLLSSSEKLIGRMKKMLFAFVKPHQANTILGVAQQTNRMFKGFIVGKILDSTIIGVLCFFGMTLLRLPYPLFISVIVGVTNVIPYFGPFLGAIPSALLILIDSPMQCLIFVFFILVLQQLDGNLIGPKVLGNTTGLSSLGVLFSILIGGGLFGLVGMVVSVPLCGVMYSILKRITDAFLRKKGLPIDTSLYVQMQGVNEQTGKIKE